MAHHRMNVAWQSVSYPMLTKSASYVTPPKSLDAPGASLACCLHGLELQGERVQSGKAKVASPLTYSCSWRCKL